MPRRPSKKQGRDINLIAKRVAEEATAPKVEEPADGKNPNAVALGRLGGKKGGEARAKKLTPERRREIAQMAARARWH